MDKDTFQQIATGISALQNTVDLAVRFFGSKDKSKDPGETDKLRSELIEAQSLMLKIHDSYAALLERKKELEEQVTQLEAWGEEKKDYQPMEFISGSGVFAFVYAPEGQVAQPVRWFCEKCYHENKKSMLQFQHQSPQPMFKCSGCGTEYYLPRPPMTQARVIR